MIDLVTTNTVTVLIRSDKDTSMEVEEHREKKPSCSNPGRAKFSLDKTWIATFWKNYGQQVILL